MNYWFAGYAFVIVAMIVSAIASWNMHRTFKKYRKYANGKGLTAEACAARIMHTAGIYDVRIERVSGALTDHYSPAEKVLRLSDSVFGSASVAALGVAAHECGHAIQHKTGYIPLQLRAISVPAAQIGSRLSWPVILIGLLLGKIRITKIGILLFCTVILFQLLTLPVEFNASRRALKILEGEQIMAGEAKKGAAKVLTAAAMTYVAGMFSSVLQLFRMIFLTRGGR